MRAKAQKKAQRDTVNRQYEMAGEMYKAEEEVGAGAEAGGTDTMRSKDSKGSKNSK